MDTTQTCPRCGGPLFQPLGRGRRRIWCSDSCRRRASEERQAAARGAVAVKRVPVDPPIAQSVEKVAASPAAARHLLQQLREKAERGGMDAPAWDGTVRAVFELAEALARRY